MAHSVIQHGAHDDWSERNNENYAGGINMGPQPGVINISGASKRARLFATTDEYRTYLQENAAVGDTVYSANSWRAGNKRSWNAGAIRSWANKPTRKAALNARRNIAR